MKRANGSGKGFPFLVLIPVIMAASQSSALKSQSEKDREFMIGTWMQKKDPSRNQKMKLLFINSGGTCSMENRLGTWSIEDGIATITFGKVANAKTYFLDTADETLSEPSKDRHALVKVSGPY